MSHRRTSGHDAAVCSEMPVLLPVIGQYVRCEILKRLAVCPSNVSTLALVMELDGSDISSHLGCLLENGLVNYDQHGKKHVYRLNKNIAVRVDGVMLHMTVPLPDEGELHIKTKLPKGFSLEPMADARLTKLG
jgi:DNA-binding transcriptional ArsR family regulator